jgi:hypothetical protein
VRSLKAIVATGAIVFVATAAGLAGAHSLQQKTAIASAYADTPPVIQHSAATAQMVTMTDAQLARLVAQLSKQTAQKSTVHAVSRSSATHATAAPRATVRTTQRHSTTVRSTSRSGNRCWYGSGSGNSLGNCGCW